MTRRERDRLRDLHAEIARLASYLAQDPSPCLDGAVARLAALRAEAARLPAAPPPPIPA